MRQVTRRQIFKDPEEGQKLSCCDSMIDSGQRAEWSFKSGLQGKRSASAYCRLKNADLPRRRAGSEMLIEIASVEDGAQQKWLGSTLQVLRCGFGSAG